MITAKEAYKETKEYINDPKKYEDYLYHYFLRRFEYSGINRLFNRLIKEQICSKKFSLTINLKGGQDCDTEEREFIWFWQGVDELKSLTKYLNKLGYSVELHNTNNKLKYIDISWSEANK